MIVEELERMLLNEGWYLHMAEWLRVNDRDLFRGRVRFACRPPVDFGYFIDGTTTTASVFYKIKLYAIYGEIA